LIHNRTNYLIIFSFLPFLHFVKPNIFDKALITRLAMIFVKREFTPIWKIQQQQTRKYQKVKGRFSAVDTEAGPSLISICVDF